MADLLDGTRTFLQSHGLQAAPGVVAVSGGPDSVVLAHLFARLVEEGFLTGVVLAHLDHGLRGEDSTADAAFVRTLPAAWGWPDLPVRIERRDVAAEAARTGDNLETTARRLRYAWLAEVARAAGAGWVAAGHTADDQVETVLHRLVRGAGWEGWAGMRPVRPLEPGLLLVRPLLERRRSEVHAYLAAQGLACRTDASNADPRFTRNRIRLELLPLLERAFNPRVVETLLDAAALAGETHDFLEDLAEAVLREAERPRAGNVLVLDRPRLQREPPLLIRQACRRLWRREGWPAAAMTHADWRRLVDLVHGRLPAWDFPAGIRARTTARVLQLGPQPC